MRNKIPQKVLDYFIKKSEGALLDIDTWNQYDSHGDIEVTIFEALWFTKNHIPKVCVVEVPKSDRKKWYN